MYCPWAETHLLKRILIRVCCGCDMDVTQKSKIIEVQKQMVYKKDATIL